MATSDVPKVWRKLNDIVAHSSNVSSLALGKSSSFLLATGAEDCKIHIWSVNRPKCLMRLTGHTSPVVCLRFSRLENQVAAGTESGSLRMWDLESAKIFRTFSGHKVSTCCLDFHPFGNYITSGSVDANIKLWDIRKKGCVFIYKGHTQAVRHLAFSPDGRWLASASDDCTIKLWDLTAGKTLTEFTKHMSAVNAVQFHPTQYLLASGGADRTVKLWDLEKFKMIGSSEGETGPVRCVNFSPDGSCLYSGSEDTLRVYGWEPDCCFDVIHVGWGKVSDFLISKTTMIGVSCSQVNVSSYVVDLSKVKTSGSVIQGLVQDDKPLETPTSKEPTVRRNYESSTASCSKQNALTVVTADLQLPPCNIVPPFKINPSPVVIPSSSNKPIGLNVRDFLPPAIRCMARITSDEDALAQIRKGHQTMLVMLSSRHKNLNTVRTVWTCRDIKKSLESAVSIKDLSIVVDMLNIVNCKPSLWNLDTCITILPQIKALLQSKYESYVQTGYMSLKLILKRFWPIISQTLAARPSVGVDITGEERRRKCRTCYIHLKTLSKVVYNEKHRVGRHGSTFKELHLLMAPLNR